jgi:hypothetical protein
MIILIKTHCSQEKKFLVKIPDNIFADEVQRFIDNGLRKRAVEIVLDKGAIIEKMSDEEIAFISANLILTETQVHYDLM